MSVQRGGSSGWEDLQKQRFRDRIDEPSGVGPGSYTFQQWGRLEPAGGLDRNEVAELVAIEVDARLKNSSNSTDGVVRSGFEMTSSPEAFFVDEDRTTVTDPDVEGRGTEKARWLDDDDPDTLAVYYLSSRSEKIDTTNGVGAGSVSDRYQRTNRFADLGGGPVFDRHDQIYLHRYWQKSDANNYGRQDDIITIYWSVKED